MLSVIPLIPAYVTSLDLGTGINAITTLDGLLGRLLFEGFSLHFHIGLQNLHTPT